MKIILFTLTLLLVPPLFAIEPDKQKHLEISAFLGTMSYVAYSANCTKKRAYIFSILTVMALGASKELLLDERPDGEDMAYNFAGAVIAPLIFMSF